MNPQTILITGCSTGIGLAAAKILTERGHQVIATCRSDNDKKRLESDGLTVIHMELNHPESIEEGFEKALELTGGRLDVLINNAGFGQAGALEDLSRETIRNQFETNVFGLMDLTRLCIPVMRKQGHGKIINVSSLLGFVSLPFRGAYNASKYAVEGLSDTLRLELKPDNIDVILVEPGPVESQFRATSVNKATSEINLEKSHFNQQYTTLKSGYTQKKKDSVFTHQPESVVKKFIHAIESNRPKIRYRVTLPSHFFAFLKRILTSRMLDRLLSLISRQEMSK